jgi:tetratricopeptide (TPR) repeat protein
VLVWLRSRAEEHKWLTVVDNADDLSWDVSSIIPRGKAGTVLVTSQDGQASRLLGGRIPAVKVDAMQPEEAVRLVANHFGEPVNRGDCYWDLVEKITECLDRLALPLDLAGARISVDAENWGDLTNALKQYLQDYGRNQEKLLQDTEYANATPYKKTVWTAWATTLFTLKAKEESCADIYPVKLLAFLTLFDRANVQDELFRLASLGLDRACYDLDVTVPPWLQSLLEKDDTNEWNSLSYRNTIACLLRYNLVRPIIEPWKGVTMHGLVQIWARQELSPESLQWHMLYLSSICPQLEQAKHVPFRRHLMVHLPPNDILLTGQPPFQTERQMMRLWLRIGYVCGSEGRLKDAAQVQVKAVAVARKAFGDQDLETLEAMSNLALTFCRQGLLHKSKDLSSEVARLEDAALGARHPATLKTRHQLTFILQSLGDWEESVAQEMAVLEARRTELGDRHPETLESMKTLAISYSHLGKLHRAEELQFEVLETQYRLFGRLHPDTIESMSALANILSQQRKYEESKSLHLEASQAARDLFGDNHEITLLHTRFLGVSYLRQRKLTHAEELQIEILKSSEKFYGSNHLQTLKHMGDLAITRSEQGKLAEAQKMMFEVVERMISVVGEEHHETLIIMDYLICTLQLQGRWKEAVSLGSKVVANSSRALGENHPHTLTALANLALAERGLGQNDIAFDLMRRSAAISSEVLGDDHPHARARHERLAEWSAMDAQRIEDVDVSGLQNMRLS